MHRKLLWRLGAALAVAAAVVAAQLALPAHADVVTNGMTVQGSGFQVGRSYAVVVPTGLAPDQVRDEELVDVIDGIAVEPLVANATVDSAGTIHENWEPSFSGTHQLYITKPGTPYGVPAPSAVAYGPVTIQVGGSPSDPTSCGANHTACFTVHGTREVGCQLTLELTDYSIDTIGIVNAGSSQFPSAAQRTAGPNTFTFYDLNQVIATTTASGTVTASVTWTPTTSGTHTLQANFTMPSIPSYPHVLMANTGWLYMPIAPAGTTPCV
ncbi:hypothetical protein KHQ06_16530 [Nocardia tengchongensis]|uniref:Ig-like domain-containing protein n=1 Tax=Nocardia tengchongensis TaxID=2055889 RepID=A0ABX8CWF8_9NOCA|nr:hypothetical protein [Nocardia tengchongensis]QVI24231.1 hypothetical protein KHQ06_16530 [Nocardia tengchongensis]